MDYYPQPRPVLYGTSADEVPPQTQTKPVRQGPPRWPPAPPFADFGDSSGDREPWQISAPARSRSTYDARGRFIVAVIYAVAAIFALYIFIFMPQAFADLSLLSRLFLLLQIMAAPWVVPCLIALGRPAYLVALGLSILQLMLGLLAPAWLWPGLIAALCSCLYLLRPRMLLEQRVWGSGRVTGEISDFASRVHGGHNSDAVRVAMFRRRWSPPMRSILSSKPDDWKSRFN